MSNKLFIATVSTTLMMGGSSFLSPVQAANLFSSRVNFESQLNSLITDDYSNAGYQFLQNDAAMSNVLKETKYTATGIPNLNIVSAQQYCAGCNGSFNLNFTSTSVGSSLGVFGVGLNIVSNQAPFYNAFATYGDGTSENFILGSAGSFFGITSDKLINNVSFGLANGGTTTSGGFQIDNLTIGSSTAQAVPEPFTIIGTLIGGTAALRIRKKLKVIAE